MKHIRVLGAVLALSSISSAAYAETDPRDYAAIAPAKNNSMVTLGYARFVSTTDSSNLSQTVGILRALYLMKFGNLALIPFDMFVPMAEVTVYERPMGMMGMPAPTFFRASGIVEHVSGLADLTYLPTIAYVNPEGEGTSTTAALSVYVTPPTGMYDQTRVVNIGNHRWDVQPQIAVAQRISTLFTAEAVGYGVFHTENTAFLPPVPGAPLQTLKRNWSWGADVHVAYSPTVTGWIGLSYYVLANGRAFFDTPMAEVTTSPQQTTHTVRVTWGWRVEKDSLILFQFNQDVAATGEGASIGRFVGARLSHTWEL
jgi:Putative MetA-pathway of phenol degradation